MKEALTVGLLSLLLVGTRGGCPTLPENVLNPLQYYASLVQYTIDTGLVGQPRLTVNGCINVYVSRSSYIFEVGFECCSEPRIPCNESHFTYVTDRVHQWNPRLSQKGPRHLGLVICWIGGYFQTVANLNENCAGRMEEGAVCRKMASGKNFLHQGPNFAANFDMDKENRAGETTGPLVFVLVGVIVLLLFY